jgi:hypothetical protein
MDPGELGHFSLLEKIGEGGMGRVYKARDKRLDRFVAIRRKERLNSASSRPSPLFATESACPTLPGSPRR